MAKIDGFIKELEHHGFDLSIESDYAGYLGIDIQPRDDGKIHLRKQV